METAGAAPDAIDVFVSCKREDRLRVAPLIDCLRLAGFRAWWDGDIPGGASWRQSLVEHLEAARCVIVIWSEASVGPAGEFVQDEASRAKARGVFLPVRIDEVAEPLGYAGTQSLDLIGWSGDADDPRFRDLVGSAKAMIAGARPHAPAARSLHASDPRGLVNQTIGFLRRFLLDLVELTLGPKRFLAERLDTTQSSTKLLFTAAYVTSMGALKAGNHALYEQITQAVASGNLLWSLSNGERLFAQTAFRVFLFVNLFGMGVILVWTIAGWGAYRQLTGFTKLRSFAAFLLFVLFCVPVYAVTVVISAALVR